MTASGIWNLIQWVHYLALSLWIGGIVFLACVAAPSIHHSMASRAIAGEIVSKILARLNLIELGCCVILVLTSFSSYPFIQGYHSMIWNLSLAFLFMGAVTAFCTFYLSPRMQSLKQKIPTLDTLSSTHAGKMEFDRLHRMYVKLMSLNLVLGMGALYLSVVIFN
ncbi:MAG: DUF4149 domain-containing protein [Candidatus Omnitrophica bacterium]|nr:DUF4149 domain-containing protein [Candidatus Omnitrophota bacterium]